VSERTEKAPSDYVDSVIYLGEDRFEKRKPSEKAIKKSISLDIEKIRKLQRQLTTESVAISYRGNVERYEDMMT
jgi:hypothetical protein